MDKSCNPTVHGPDHGPCDDTGKVGTLAHTIGIGGIVEQDTRDDLCCTCQLMVVQNRRGKLT